METSEVKARSVCSKVQSAPQRRENDVARVLNRDAWKTAQKSDVYVHAISQGVGVEGVWLHRGIGTNNGTG